MVRPALPGRTVAAVAAAAVAADAKATPPARTRVGTVLAVGVEVREERVRKLAVRVARVVGEPSASISSPPRQRSRAILFSSAVPVTAAGVVAVPSGRRAAKEATEGYTSSVVLEEMALREVTRVVVAVGPVASASTSSRRWKARRRFRGIPLN